MQFYFLKECIYHFAAGKPIISYSFFHFLLIIERVFDNPTTEYVFMCVCKCFSFLVFVLLLNLNLSLRLFCFRGYILLLLARHINKYNTEKMEQLFIIHVWTCFNTKSIFFYTHTYLFERKIMGKRFIIERDIYFSFS